MMFVVRSLLAVLALFILGPSLALSQTQMQTASYRAGVATLPASADRPFELLVWYPTTVDEVPWQAGPAAIPATRDAPFAAGRFPVVLLSHGGGPTGGSPLILRDLSAGLARSGYVVVAPLHRQAPLAVRTRQLGQALAAVAADPRLAAHLDTRRLGLLGYSLGGAVVLEAAGATPSVDRFRAYCSVHRDDFMSCDPGPAAGPSKQDPSTGRQAGNWTLAARAIVLLDPYALPFERRGLLSVAAPVLILRPRQSELAGEPNGLGLATALASQPVLRFIAGNHWVFTDVCEPALRKIAPDICRDPSGVERKAVHAEIQSAIAKFLGENL